MTQTNDALASAIAALGAVEVAPGRYAIPPTSDSYWRMAAKDEMELFALSKGVRRIWWRQARLKMPAWWSPERRYYMRRKGETTGVPIRSPEPHKQYQYAFDIITASLETGEEVPA